MKRFTKLLSVLLAVSLLLGSVSAGVAYAETAKTIKETESNNAFTSADAIEFGADVEGSLANGEDVDWFKFTSNDGGTIAVSFAHPKTESSYSYFTVSLIRLVGETGKEETVEITSADVRGIDDTVSLARCALTKGTYYIKVESGAVSASDTYTLNVTIDTNQLSERELNDTAAEATALQLSTSASGDAEAKDFVYIGAAGTANDVDYFTFSAPARGYVYVYLYNSPIDNNPIDYKVSLCSFKEGTSAGDPEELGYFVSNAGTQTNVSPSYGVESRTYFVKIEADDEYRQGNEYQIKVKFVAFDSFEVESNNSPKTASKFEAKDEQQNLSIYGAISLCKDGADEDWFKITYNAGTVEKLELAFSALTSPKTAAWTIDVYKKDVVHAGNSEAYAQYRYGETLTGKGGEEARITLSEEIRGSGEFYVRVTGVSTAFSTNDYLLIPIFTRGEAPQQGGGSVFDGLKDYFDSLGTIDWSTFLDNFAFVEEFIWSDVPLTFLTELVNIFVFILNFFAQ